MKSLALNNITEYVLAYIRSSWQLCDNSVHVVFVYTHHIDDFYYPFPIQYLGKWYFVGVASWDNEDIASFNSLDNSVVELRKGENNTLIMAGALHQWVASN